MSGTKVTSTCTQCAHPGKQHLLVPSKKHGNSKILVEDYSNHTEPKISEETTDTALKLVHVNHAANGSLSTTTTQETLVFTMPVTALNTSSLKCTCRLGPQQYAQRSFQKN